MRILISGGRIVDPRNGADFTGDLAIADGRVLAVGKVPADFQAQQHIVADGKVVCPGLVDLSVRLREPGQEHKGTIASETLAAAAGGVCTVCIPPDTDPVIDSPAVVELIRQRAEDAGRAHVAVLGAITRQLKGTHITEMHALQQAGCVGVSNGMTPIANALVQRRAMEYASGYGLKTYLYPEDSHLANGGCMHEGAISLRMGLSGIPECAESIAVSRDLLLVEQTGAPAHFCRLSSGRALEMVAHARQQGLPVSADVAVHHLHLTDVDLVDFNSYCHVRPPLRAQRDQQALLAGLQSGAIGAICSDHQPHETSAKLLPFAETEPGISGLETLLPLALRAGHAAKLSLLQTLALLTSGPAAILGLDCGHLSVGAVADVCVFDPQASWLVTPSRLHSEGKNTPFVNWEMQGRVQHTLLAGRVVYDAKMEKL